MAERFLIQCGDHWENQCRILPLALEAKARGWEPVVLTYQRDQGSLFVAHGVATCPLDLAGRRPAKTYAFLDAPRAAVWGRWGGVAGRRFREVFEIERQRNQSAFDTPAKRRKKGRAIVRNLAVLEEVLALVQPSRVAVWNGLTGVVANLLRLLAAERSIPAVFLERALLPNAVFVDPLGTNGFSSLHLRTELPPVDPGGTRLPSVVAEETTPLLEREGLAGSRVLFVPLQVQADTNILFHSDHIKRMNEFVSAVADAAPEDAWVVVRPHPEEAEPDLRLPEHPKVRYVTSGSVEQWCDAAALTITVNSTVGLTALLRGRAVLALGRAIYTGKGLTRDVHDADLRGLLASAETYLPPPPERVERFYQLLVDEHTVRAGGRNLGVPAPGVPRGGAVSGERLTTSLERACVDAQDAERIRSVWQERLAAARGWDGELWVWARIDRRHWRNLTYRNTREELNRETLLKELGELLGRSPERVHLSKRPPPEDSCERLLVVLQGQSSGECSSDATLVLDQYLQPHLGWFGQLALGIDDGVGT